MLISKVTIHLCSRGFLMLKKLGTATLAAAAALSFAAPSQAVTITIPTTSITDIFNPITPGTPNGGFKYSAGSSQLGPFGNISAGGNAQAGVSPTLTTLPSAATYSFDYQLGNGTTLVTELFAYDNDNVQVFQGTLGSLVFGTDATSGTKTYDFTSLLLANEKYSVKFTSTGGTALFSNVSLNITPAASSSVPEPVEAPVLCMLLVAGGALVLRLRKPATAEQANLN